MVGLFFVVFSFLGLSIYLAVIWQLRARRVEQIPEMGEVPGKTFGFPEAGVAVLLILFLLTNAIGALARPEHSIQLTNRDLILNFAFTAFVVCLVAALLALRGIDIDSLAGLSKISLKRAVSTGIILMLAATPLIVLAEAINQNFFGGGASKQEIVELFSSSPSIEQRTMVIVLAVVVAPIAEEFIFRFFVYGVLRRYLGVGFSLIFTSILFAVAHTHLPSALPLFVLACCFNLAYEWSGSILVSMAMHTLFNSVQLIFLAFPNLFRQ